MFLVERDVVVAGMFKLSGLSLIWVANAAAVVLTLPDSLFIAFSTLCRLAMILSFLVYVIADLV